MFKNLKSVFTRKKSAQPKLVLTDADKIYLATAIKHTKKLSFVYVLACQKQSDGRYALEPNTTIATFDSRKNADMYYQTMGRMLDMQQSFPGPRQIAELQSEKIRTFLQNAR